MSGSMFIGGSASSYNLVSCTVGRRTTSGLLVDLSRISHSSKHAGRYRSASSLLEDSCKRELHKGNHSEGSPVFTMQNTRRSSVVFFLFLLVNYDASHTNGFAVELTPLRRRVL